MDQSSPSPDTVRNDARGPRTNRVGGFRMPAAGIARSARHLESHNRSVDLGSRERQLGFRRVSPRK